MSYEPYDKDRMIVSDNNEISNNFTTNLMNEFSIQLNFHEYKNVKDIFLSKSKKVLFFPKFNYEQSNYKCLLEHEFNTFLLILQNIKPDLIFLNESIQIHETEMFIPKINIINNKILPRLIIIPINIYHYQNDVIVGGHKNVIIINTLIKTITFFEPYGVLFTNTVSYNIIKEHFSETLINYTFIDALYPNTEFSKFEKKNVDDKFENYYIKLDKYTNILKDIRLNPDKKKITKEIKKIRKKITKIKNKETLNNIVKVQNERFTKRGPQYRQELVEDFGDKGGHCVAWSLYIVFLTFINVNLFKSKFMKNVSISSFINNLLLEKIDGESLSPHILSNMIRQFINYVIEFNRTLNKFIITKGKPSKTVHIKFDNNTGDYSIMSSEILHKNVLTYRTDTDNDVYMTDSNIDVDMT